MMISMAFFSLNLKNRDENLPIWVSFDKSDFFCVDLRTQRRYILYTILICVPSIFSATWEVDWYRNYAFSKYPDAKIYLDSLSPSLDLIVSHGLGIIYSISAFLRYRPFITMIYSIMCVRKHLQYLNSQIDIYYAENKRNIKIDLGEGELYQSPVRNEGRADEIIDEIEFSLHMRKVNRKSQQGICASSLNSARKSEQSCAATSAETSTGATGNNNTSRGPRQEINNLHQFENHLTRLSLFIKHVDIDSSLVVVVTIFYHFGLIFNTLFLFREFTLGFSHFIVIFYNIFGMLPPLTLFTFGTLMERESRSLMSKLEYLYLQEETQCFMYRQLSGMKYPLWSIFKLLGSIEFNCDQLMHVGLSTVKDISILLGGSAFVVIQYGE